MYIAKVTTYKRGEHEQSTDGGETTTVGGETSRWRNVLVAKRLGGETSRGRNVQGAKRPVKGRNVHKPMSGLLHLVQRGGALGRAATPPSPLFAVPNVIVHPSTASVPTSICGTVIASEC